MFKTILFVAVTALAFQPAQAANTSKSDDAVVAFDDLCVSLFTGKKSEVDPARFSVTKIGDDTARKIKPAVKGPLWDVSGTKSGVRMLVHYESAGLCVVEVAEADERSIRTAFEGLVQQTSAAFKSPPQRQPDKRNSIEGKDATTSMWRMGSPKGDVMLVVTTYPDAKFMIQHLMTASYVK